MLFLVTFFIAVGGIVSEEVVCDFDKVIDECLALLGDSYLLIENIPEKEEILQKCPAELKYYECFLERKGQCNWEEGSFERFMKGSYGVTKDLCNEDSKLHKAYIANAECYRTLGGDVDTCLSLAKAVYRSSFALLNHTKPEDLEEEWISIEATCLLESVQIACLSEKVLKTCGEDAYDTMMEVITRSHVLTIYCSRDMVNILKTSILDSLDLDEAAREIYSHAFHTIEK